MIDFKLIPTLIVLSCIIAACILFIATVIIRHKYKKKKNPDKKLAIIFIIIPAIICIAASGILITTTVGYNIAIEHGLYTSDTTIGDMFRGIEKSPVPDTIADKDVKGKILLFYKFGCKDCETIYDELQESTKDADVLWVSTRSEEGKKLVEAYGIVEVPTGIYIRNNAYNDALPYTKKLLYKVDEDGNSQYDKTAVDRLIYLQNEKR